VALPRLAQAAPYLQGTPANAGAASSINVTYPSGAISGLAAILAVKGSDVVLSSITSGWTLIDSIQPGNPGSSAFFWRHCYTAGDTNPTVTWTAATSGSRGIIFMKADTNCQDSTANNPVDQHHFISGGNTTFNTTSLTPSAANEDYDVFGTYCVLGTAPSGVIPLLDDHTNLLGDYYRMTAGSAATGVETYSVGACNGFFEQILFNPASTRAYTPPRAFTKASTTGASSLNVAVAPNVQNNDAVMMFVNVVGTQTVSVPSFSAVRTDAYSGCCFSQRWISLCHTAASDAGNYTITPSSGTPEMEAYEVPVYNTTCPPDASNGTSTNSSVGNFNGATVSATNPKELVFGAWEVFNGSTAIALPNFPIAGIFGVNTSTAMGFFVNAASGTTATQNATSGSAPWLEQTVAMPNVGGSGGGAGIAIPLWRNRGGY
jgi:hypothetical protein